MDNMIFKPKRKFNQEPVVISPYENEQRLRHHLGYAQLEKEMAPETEIEASNLTVPKNKTPLEQAQEYARSQQREMELSVDPTKMRSSPLGGFPTAEDQQGMQKKMDDEFYRQAELQRNLRAAAPVPKFGGLSNLANQSKKIKK